MITVGDDEVIVDVIASILQFGIVLMKFKNFGRETVVGFLFVEINELSPLTWLLNNDFFLSVGCRSFLLESLV